jgi:RNA polymerase sigma-70 factor (ECF subfamily)
MMWNTNPDAAGLRNVTTTRSLNGDFSIEHRERYAWPDERLMEAVVARDDLAFAVLYDRYVDVVYSTAYRVLRDVQLAEDATQDIFVRLWRTPGRFEPARGRFVTWLLSVVRNRAVDELRARGRRRRREGNPGSPESDFLETIPCDSDDPVVSVQLHERQALVRTALATLPREQRLALELSYFSGLTQQQISDSLHEPLGTVKTRIRLGMQKLRRALDGQV